MSSAGLVQFPASLLGSFRGLQEGCLPRVCMGKGRAFFFFFFNKPGQEGYRARGSLDGCWLLSGGR